MAIFDRFNISVAAGAGLCGVAIVLSPEAAAAPTVTPGAECVQGKGEECIPSAPIADMAGVPMALPGPLPAAPPVPVAPPVPMAPPVPLAPPVPVVPAAPAAAPVPLAPPVPSAPLIPYGKELPTAAAPAGAPVAGQPTPAGPSGG